jgi:hypothetical protein
MRTRLGLFALAAFAAAGIATAAIAQPGTPDWTGLLATEEARICDLADDPSATVQDLAEAQIIADTILREANAALTEAELHRLFLGAGLLIAASNAFVETKSGGVEMARIALGGTTFTLATVLALKSGDVDQARAMLAEGDVTAEELDAANGLAVELYVALSLHGATLVSAAGLDSSGANAFPGLNEIFLFKSDVPSLLADAPNISDLMSELGEAVEAALVRNHQGPLSELSRLEARELPSLRTALADTAAFHQRASNCIAPTLN